MAGRTLWSAAKLGGQIVAFVIGAMIASSGIILFLELLMAGLVIESIVAAALVCALVPTVALASFMAVSASLYVAGTAIHLGLTLVEALFTGMYNFFNGPSDDSKPFQYGRQGGYMPQQTSSYPAFPPSPPSYPWSNNTTPSNDPGHDLRTVHTDGRTIQIPAAMRGQPLMIVPEAQWLELQQSAHGQITNQFDRSSDYPGMYPSRELDVMRDEEERNHQFRIEMP